MSGSVLFYVQHLLGVGHLERALRLTSALAQAGMRVTLVSGGESRGALQSAAAERIVQLSPVMASDASFRELVDGSGKPIGERLRGERREALLAAFRQARPDVVILESFPFGRRAFRFELDPLIAVAGTRHPRPLLLSSIRDILVAPSTAAKSREVVGRVRAEFDAVLVHGDPALVTLEKSFPQARAIADRLVYTGYVGREEAAPPAAERRDEILVSAGGGAVGGALLRAALEVRRVGCLSGSTWRLVAGANLPPEDYEHLAGRLDKGVVLERHRSDFASLVASCRVSVSQAGYNTMLDLLAAAVPAVVVPFAAGREVEQTLRAEVFAARGLVETVAESDLTPARLGAAILRAAERPPRRVAVDTAGAARTARILGRMLGHRRGRLVSGVGEAIIAQ